MTMFKQSRLILVLASALFIIEALCIADVEAQVQIQQSPATSVSTIDRNEQIDITDRGFRLVVCDGPAGANTNNDPNYVVCDFNAIMKQVQRLINVAMVAGVLVAIFGFIYAGLLMISGAPDKINHAKKIFRGVLIGFIIMLSAWFIVYQVLDWLTEEKGYSSLLGNP